MMPAPTAKPGREWLVPTALIVLSLVPSVAGTARLSEIFAGGPVSEANARFFAMPLPVVLHILAAIPFDILGALQFSVVLRTRGSRWHSIGGRVLLPMGFLIALSGLWMTRAYAVALGAGTQVFTHIPWFILVGALTVGPRAVMMGAAWVINVAVAEWVISRRRGGRVHAPRLAGAQV
jgi:uncharacterized membrane protein